MNLIDFERAISKGEDIVEASYELIDSIEEGEACLDDVELILKIIEKYPDVDFGTPGPLVHFVERFFKNGYEEKLVESLGRKATSHSLWMLNRLINGCEGTVKDSYILLLSNLTKSKLPTNLAQQASHYLDLHR